VKTHLSIVRPGPFGGTLYTSLCRRMSGKSEGGMNVTDNRADVTCDYCLRAIADRSPMLRYAANHSSPSKETIHES
jgi:hypothetical protein